jgi:hypothetical protein
MKAWTAEDRGREYEEARIKQQRDERSRLKAAWLEGYAEGYAQGIAEGLVEGELIEKIRFSQHLLQRPLTSEEELVALPPEEVHRLAEQWENELLSKYLGKRS